MWIMKVYAWIKKNFVLNIYLNLNWEWYYVFSKKTSMKSICSVVYKWMKFVNEIWNTYY